MQPAIPKHGPMSGMIVPAIAAAIVLPLGLLSANFRSHFTDPMSPTFLWVFLASAVLMALHKVESFWFGEFDQCPVYVSQPVENPRKAVFLAFCPIFIGMLFFAVLAFMGPPWHLILLAVWLGQGLHELHHTAKSLARGRLYPGLITSVLFVGVMSFGLFPMWHDSVIGSRGLLFYGYYVLMPLVFLAHYREDRKWIAAAPESIWNPESAGLPEAAPATATR